ncbi:hypothetical protein [Streptomyces griseorubiginosus]|nr:hypothetical protein [Streptomyces griseorubiginosus]
MTIAVSGTTAVCMLMKGGSRHLLQYDPGLLAELVKGGRNRC